MPSDPELLRCYAEDQSEAAFAELVRRHLDLVYFAALRQVGGDAHTAADVTQSVFTDLARKAAPLWRRPVLASWLYTSTRFAAAKARRAAERRRHYEQEAETMNVLLRDGDAPADWERVRPWIDDAVHGLNEREREALLLRFFEGRGFGDVGRTLNVSEDAARMRVERALEKLRTLLARRGVTSSATALTAALAHQAALAAPAGMAASVTSGALAGATTTGAATALGVLHFMSTTKIITTAASIVALVAIGVALRETRQAQAATAALAMATHEQDAMRRREAEAEARTRVSEENLAAAQKQLDAQRSTATAATTPVASTEAAAARALSSLTASPLEYVLEHPEKRAAYIEQEVVRARARFERFFQQAQLSPAQQEQFMKNIREFAEQRLDFMGALRTAGVNAENLPADNASVAQMGRMEKQIPLDLQNNMRALLGDAGFQQYQTYTRVLPLRNTVAEVASRLYDTDTPLTPVQAAQLTDIMKENPFRLPERGFQGNTVAGAFVPVAVYNGAKTQLNLQGGSTFTEWHEPVSDAAATRATAILSAPQLAALRQVQEQQVAQLMAAPPPLARTPDAPKPAPTGGK
jgi:RNA polymerase sigma factor (sigma-70 family)